MTLRTLTRSPRLSSTLTSGERAEACGYGTLFSVLMIAPLSFDFDPILCAVDHAFLGKRIVWHVSGGELENVDIRVIYGFTGRRT